MDIGVISVRYARALWMFAVEQKMEDKVYAEMDTLTNSFLEVSQLRLALENPRYTQRQKIQLLVQASGGEVSPVTNQFFLLVLRQHREMFLQFMSNAFVSLYREQKNRVPVSFTTAAPTTTDVLAKLQQVMADITHDQVELRTKTDPTILGGFIIDYDTYRIDASMKNELKRIRRKLGGSVS